MGQDCPYERVWCASLFLNDSQVFTHRNCRNFWHTIHNVIDGEFDMRQQEVYKSDDRHSLQKVGIAVLLVGLFAAFLLPASSARADDAATTIAGTQVSALASLSQVEIAKSYALGLNRFDLDVETELLGWRLSNSWYFGRQDGLDSGLTFVYQQEENQVSVSKDGLRLTRRF